VGKREGGKLSVEDEKRRIRQGKHERGGNNDGKGKEQARKTYMGGQCRLSIRYFHTLLPVGSMQGRESDQAPGDKVEDGHESRLRRGGGEGGGLAWYGGISEKDL
jgi:hypothetical protein